jgi:hypothetical protein
MDKFLSRKFIVAVAVTILATVIFLLTDKLSDRVWSEMLIWIIGLYLATNAASKYGSSK